VLSAGKDVSGEILRMGCLWFFFFRIRIAASATDVVFYIRPLSLAKAQRPQSLPGRFFRKNRPGRNAFGACTHHLLFLPRSRMENFRKNPGKKNSLRVTHQF
jgi:hypothetical protein